MATYSDKKNTYLGVILSYVSLALSIVSALFITPVILNHIGDANYGLFSFCSSITTWLTLISSALGSSYIYFASKNKKEQGDERSTNTIFRKLLTIIAFGSLILVALAILIIKLSGFQFSNYDEEQNKLISILFVISGVQVVITVLFSIYNLYNTYKKSFIFVKGTQIVLTIAVYAANVVVAITTKSIVFIALIALANSLLAGVSNLIFAVKAKKMTFEKKGLKEYKDDVSAIARYSSIILVSFIVGNLDSSLDKTLLGIMCDAESVAMYQLSVLFVGHMTTVSYAFAEVMRPTFYDYYRNGKEEEANRLFVKVCKMQSIVVLLFVGGYLSCGYHFTETWIGNSRINVFFYSAVLFVSNIVPLTSSMLAEAHKATSTHKMPMIFSVISISINLIFTIVFLLAWEKGYSVWACIIGTVIPRIVFGWIISPIYAKKKINLPIKKYYLNLAKDIAIAAVSVGLSLLAFFFVKETAFHNIWKILIEGSSFVVCYSLGMLLFERDTVTSLFSYLKRK